MLLNRQYSETRHWAVRLAPARRNLWALVFCGVGLVFLTGCSVNVGGRQRPLLRHDRIQGELELVVERRSDEQGTSGNKRKSKTKVFEERLRLKTEGDVYHSDFLFYTAALGFGLAQQSIRWDGQSDRNSSSLNDYNVFAQLLRAKEYPMIFHASKSEDLIARQFLGSLRTETESSGASLSLRSEDWPMTFQYTTSEASQDGLASLARDFFKRDDERFRYSAAHDFSELSHINFNFDRTEVSQQSLGASINTETDTYTLLHDLMFGGDEQHRLDSFFNFLDQSGSFDFENLQLEERLRLQHSSSFLTNYGVRFTDSKRETFRSKETRGRAGFEHRLYESLVTTADAFTSKTDLAAQGDLTQHGGTLAFNYRKKNPWGTLRSTYMAGLTESKQSGGSGIGYVNDESHVFTDPLPVVLDRVNIDTSLPIVVTDSTGTDTYIEDQDYTITARKDGRVELNIIAGEGTPPDISDGQTLLIDYSFFIEPERQEDTFRQNFTIKERFDNGLSLYYAHRRQDEDVSSSITQITPDEFRINTFGADYVKKGLALLAEYNKESSTQIPSTGKKLEGRYSWPINSDTSASLRALNHWLDFGEPDARDITLFKGGAEIFSRLTDEYNISARFDYRDEDDSRFGTTDGFQLRSELQYNYRQLSITTGVEFNMLERRSDEIKGTFLYFRLRRVF